MNTTTINRSRLFTASCFALLVTSLSFGIRAGMLGDLGAEFGLDKSQLGTIAATAFWGFPLAVIIGGIVVDIIGMKKLLVFAFIFHALGILLTIFAGKIGSPFLSLFFSTLFIGLANGTVEAACNPLVTAIYPDNKTTKLNHFHLWFPGGILIGSLIVFLFKKIGIGWQIQMAIMLIPTIIYGYLFSKEHFPATERVSSGISNAEMYKSLGKPLYIFMFICMFGTAITELFTGQWVGVLLKNVVENSILILAVSTGLMVIGRAFAGPILRKLSPQGVLLASAIISALGLYLLGHTSGSMLFFAAIVFGIGVCYFWPTMLGFIAEYLPKTGAVGLNLIGGAGMFAVSIYTIIMGGAYDKMLSKHLPTGSDLKTFNAPEATEQMKAALAEANRLAGPEILTTTLVIPIVLTIAFGGLFFWMKAKNIKPENISAAH